MYADHLPFRPSINVHFADCFLSLFFVILICALEMDICRLFDLSQLLILIFFAYSFLSLGFWFLKLIYANYLHLSLLNYHSSSPTLSFHRDIHLCLPFTTSLLFPSLSFYYSLFTHPLEHILFSIFLRHVF